MIFCFFRTFSVKWNEVLQTEAYVNQVSNLDKLPVVGLDLIFKKMDNLSRIKVAIALPNHIKTLAQPIYWTSFSVRFNKTTISFQDLQFLCKYQKNHLKKINVNLCSYNFVRVDKELDDLFRNLSSLEAFVCNAYNLTETYLIVEFITKYMKNLKCLDISWRILNNDDVIRIIDNLENLDSIEITTDKDIRSGLKYIFTKSKPLKKFGPIQKEVFIDSE